MDFMLSAVPMSFFDIIVAPRQERSVDGEYGRRGEIRVRNQVSRRRLAPFGAVRRLISIVV